jgi:hypothetical protein
MLGVVTLLGMGGSVLAQSAVTTADLQRLEDNIDAASKDLTQVRSRDASLASQLERELADLRDDTVYLKVKVRRDEPVARSEYSQLRDRIEAVRSRARGDEARPAAQASGSDRSDRSDPSREHEIPIGTEFDVRLQDALSSKTAAVEDRFQVTTMVDLRDDERVIVPAGSTMRGVVNAVNKAGRLERKGSLSVTFDQVTVRNRSYPVSATVTEALESEGVRGEAGRIGTGAGVGAIIGGILGGFKGALAGILIGGGGTIAATEGTDVELASGTVLRVRLDTPLSVR